MRYIIKFSKQGYIKYISHLDMIRMFKRAFKKAEIHLKHSQGFNPHPKMTFGQPLSLGYTSVGELLEIETKEDFEPSVIISKLQEQLPLGIEIISCEKCKENQKGIAGQITEAEYEIVISDMPQITVDNITAFAKSPQIITYKKQKKKKELKEVDIKPLIRKITAKQDNDKIFMTTVVDCGSSSNLNPDLLIKALAEGLNLTIPAENVEIQRNYLK